MLDEEAIIRERIVTSEATYKRVAKALALLTSQDEPSEETRNTVDRELDSFDMMVLKLQLQLVMNEEEMEMYQKQNSEGVARSKALSEKTLELQQQLADAQRHRAEREECNEMVDSMLKPKKVVVSDEPGAVPIIALLNTTRSEDEKLNVSLAEEIAELESQQAQLRQDWDSRRAKFDALMSSIQAFRTEIIQDAKSSLEQDGSDEAQPSGTATPAEFNDADGAGDAVDEDVPMAE